VIAGQEFRLFFPSERALSIFGALRNSERMAMPIIYVLPLVAITCCLRTCGGRATGWLLATCLAVQIIDLSPAIAARRALIAEAPAGIPPRLFDPFWAQAAKSYRRIRAVPAANMGPGWQSIAQFAMQSGMATDSVYLARVDRAAVKTLRAHMAERLADGAYEPATLYVLRDSESLALARQSHDPTKDAILNVDGYWVLAPGWLASP
jgi:hypothetical protein